MRLLSRSSSLRLLALSPALSSLCAANHAETYPSAHDTSSILPTADIFSPWRLFRSWVVSTIAGPSPANTLTGPDFADRFRQAQYGKDVVLRFNISTAYEAAAFTEACDTLFLDVWESADSWVDVRVSEDVVRDNALLPSSCRVY